MGKSAKVHKRVSKKLTSKTTTAVTTLNPKTSSSSIQPQVQAAKKRANLKGKTTKEKGPGGSKSNNGVLGGADYVTLLMGGRRKADEEAKKLPQDDS